MDTALKGLCVGGPLTGQWHSEMYPQQEFSETPLNALELVRRFKPKLWFQRAGSDGAVTTYHHVVAEGFCEFWVPEGKDEFWALAQLVRAYRKQERPGTEDGLPPAPFS